MVRALFNISGDAVANRTISATKVCQLVADKQPYKKCRLIHHNYDLTKRWYVIFYAWNINTEKLERVRIFQPINKQKTVHKRIAIAEQFIHQTNADLAAGKVLGKKSVNTSKERIEQKTLLQCIDYFVEKKRAARRRENYLKRFAGLKLHINDFYNAYHLADIKIIKVDQEFCEHFFDHIRPKWTSNKTFNNYRGDFIAVMNFINRVKPGTIKDKPWGTSEKLRTVAKKHAAFNDSQLKAIIKQAKAMGYHQLVFFLQFMYYTLARPKEIIGLKIRDMDLQNNWIMFVGDNAKNWRDEFVTVSDQFKKIILTSGVMKSQNPNHYVFGWQPKENGKRATSLEQPGEFPHPDEVYFYSRTVKVLTALDLYTINPNFTMYSFKHSGAIALYLQTLDLMALKEQARWTKIQQAEDYLRDLGLLRNESPVRKFKGVI
jgi:integrase